MTAYKPDVSPSATSPEATPVEAPPEQGTLHRRTWASRLSVSNIGAVYVLIVICIVFTIWAPSTFPQMATVKQILDDNAITARACRIEGRSAAASAISSS